MSAGTVNCPRCGSFLPPEKLNTAEPVPCAACGTAVQAAAFPALARSMPRGDAGERVLIEGESSCYYHPAKKAAVPCDRCGRFLCALCDVDLGSEHVCPVCLAKAAEKGTLTTVESRRPRYDNMALTLAILPLFLCFPVIVTAPATIIFAIRKWNAPRSLVQKGRGRLIAAMVIAGFEIAGLIAFAIPFFLRK